MPFGQDEEKTHHTNEELSHSWYMTTVMRGQLLMTSDFIVNPFSIELADVCLGYQVARKPPTNIWGP